VSVFDGRTFVPANQVVHDPGFREPSPGVWMHLKQQVGEDKANELAEHVTLLTIALFDAMGDAPISEGTAQQVVAAAACATADRYAAGLSDL
jgi:hypothetical protein